MLFVKVYPMCGEEIIMCIPDRIIDVDLFLDTILRNVKGWSEAKKTIEEAINADNIH